MIGTRVEVCHLKRERKGNANLFPTVCKSSFHLSGTVTEKARHRTLQRMVNAMDRFIMASGINTAPFELMKFMKMAPHFYRERRIVGDTFKAYASIAIFFETGGKPMLYSELHNQAWRAKYVPSRRTHRSVTTMPEEFWDDWNKLDEENAKLKRHVSNYIYPLEWKNAIRPIIVRLYKCGIIRPSYNRDVRGAATAAREPNRPLDLHIEYQQLGIGVNPAITDPTTRDRNYLVKTAKSFRAQHLSARFSVLRMWSSPYFYPIKLDKNMQSDTVFVDDRGRFWEWKFVPKGFPHSEWKVQMELDNRMRPYKDIFGEQVIVAKDMLFVMGKDERDCRRLSEGVTWAVQMEPWLHEVDFWRSFVNVNVEFLEGLDHRWLE
jgi:hypothetical protein